MSTNIHELMKPTGELPRCDGELFREGKTVALIAGGSAKLIDRFVRELAEYSGERVDWHYMGGRARVVTTEDAYYKVRDALVELRLSVDPY